VRPDEVRTELWARKEASEHLLAFTQYTFPGFEVAAHHHIIADALEAVERGDLKRVILTAPPRHTKSELASKRFPAWYLGRNPTKQLITASYADDLASDWGRAVRGIVVSQEYKNVFSMDLAVDSRAAGRWNTDCGGTYIATGVGGPITGRGGDVLLLDDYVKNRMEADSETYRESAWRWFTSTFYTRLQPGGAIIILATRWHEDDIIGRCLEQEHEHWHLIELPAINEAGVALWPEWFPLETLEQIKSTIGPRDWQALYMQNPRPESGIYFSRNWFKRYELAPEHLSVYITHDFAVTEDGGDYSEIAVWGIDPEENIFALDWWHGQKTLDVTIDALIDLAFKHRPRTVFGESGVIRRAVEPFLSKCKQERGCYFVEEWINRSGDKQAMAQAIRARCSMGKVHFPKNDWAERVINQCVSFPAGKHDDAVDACALLGLALDKTQKAQVAMPYRSRWKGRRKRSAWTR
jgi:predicted phage terminase large subunit-like protein